MAEPVIEERMEIPAAHEANIFGQYDVFAKKLERAYRAGENEARKRLDEIRRFLYTDEK